MGRERFERVGRLFDAAREVEPEQRAVFLREACDGDESLQREVESLLDLEQQTTIDRPAIEIAAELLARSPESGAPAIMRRFLPSEVIGDRFEIVAFLSHGGMGDVYEARDLHLGGRVALKTIRPEYAGDARITSRFKQEILLAKKVTHPNVCRIYDLGFHSEARQDDESGARPSTQGIMFLTMEFLGGETLSARLRRGSMTRSEAFPIIDQIAAGLNAAHQAGIVHRDFKSSNVMLVPGDGSATRAVITDFGLARYIQLRQDQTSVVSLTKEGQIAGTPDYMAPEQVLGAEITRAVDIYALGIVMYEMLTGRRPFDADTPLAGLVKRLHERPLSPRKYIANLDRSWETTILRCLEREPSDRFASTLEIVQALVGRWTPQMPIRMALPRRSIIYAGLISAGSIAGSLALWRTFRTDEEISIAILPLINTDSTLDYLTEGITEDLINGFGQRPALRVMSRAAVYQYKDSKLLPQELGRKLNVRFLLTGRAAQKGEYISINAELTDTRNGVHLWGQQYKRPMSGISAIEEDISREVLNKLQVQFPPDEQKRFARRRAVNAEATELYWKGRFFWNKRTQDGFSKAIEYFTRAIEKDPGFALAYTGLADSYAMQSGAIPPREAFPKAKTAALKALELDDTLAEAHASLAFIQLFYEWDWMQTEKEYRRAIQLNPSYASAHSMYSMYLVAMKRFDESLAQMKRALELDPASLPINTGIGRVLFFARRYNDAAAQYSRTLELNPDFAEALFDLGKTFAAQGRYNDAIRLLERGLKTAPETTGAIAELAYVYNRAGRKREAELAVESLLELSKRRYVSPYFIAVANLGMHDDAALDFLERAWQDRSFSMIYLDVDYHFDRLRSHPRYKSLLQRLRFLSA